jgi:hypothetical protein
VTGCSGGGAGMLAGPAWIACRPGGCVRLVFRGGRSCGSGQVRHIARTVSVAVRADRRMGACGHGHIDDMHRARLS